MGLNKSETPNFFIENKSMKLKVDLTNIAKNKGQTLTGFVRSKLIEIRDSYPENMRQAQSAH